MPHRTPAGPVRTTRGSVNCVWHTRPPGGRAALGAPEPQPHPALTSVDWLPSSLRDRGWPLLSRRWCERTSAGEGRPDEELWAALVLAGVQPWLPLSSKRPDLAAWPDLP